MLRPRLWQAARVQPVHCGGVTLNLEAVALDGETGKRVHVGVSPCGRRMGKAVAKLRTAASASLATRSERGRSASPDLGHSDAIGNPSVAGPSRGAPIHFPPESPRHIARTSPKHRAENVRA